MSSFGRQGLPRSGHETGKVLARDKHFVEDASKALREAVEGAFGEKARKRGKDKEKSASFFGPDSRSHLPRRHSACKGPAPRFKISSLEGKRAGESLLARRLLIQKFQRWWAKELRTPLGVCGCGCGQRTERAGWTSSSRGTVYGEPLPFLPYHRSRWGWPDLTQPNRRCACGCGKITPLARNTRKDEWGSPREFSGMRGEYLNRHHRPPAYSPGLVLDTLLGISAKPPPDPFSGEDSERREEVRLVEEDLRWLAEVANSRLSFVRDRGKLTLKIESTDRNLVERFAKTTARGLTYSYEPGREGASRAWYWTTRSALEAANVLLPLFDSLSSERKSRAAEFLAEYGFPVPKVEPRTDAITEAAEEKSGPLMSGERGKP